MKNPIAIPAFPFWYDVNSLVNHARDSNRLHRTRHRRHSLVFFQENAHLGLIASDCVLQTPPCPITLQLRSAWQTSLLAGDTLIAPTSLDGALILSDQTIKSEDLRLEIHAERLRFTAPDATATTLRLCPLETTVRLSDLQLQGDPRHIGDFFDQSTRHDHTLPTKKD